VKSSSFDVKKNKFDANFELIFWDTGSISIPEISIDIMSADSAVIYSINSDSLIVNVVSVKEKNLNLKSGSDGILPIKGPVEIQSYENINLILKIVLLIVFGYAIISLWRKRIKKEFSSKSPQYYQKPSVIALEKLEKMKQSDISKNNLKKEFFVEISFVLREYIENSFFIRALEMTTEEIVGNSQMLPLDKDLTIKLTSILEHADLVKYAKHDKDDQQCLKDLENSIVFIKKSSSKFLTLVD